MGRVLESVIKNLLLYLDRDPVANPRRPAGLLEEAIEAFFIDGLLDIVKMLSTDSQPPTCFTYVAERAA